MLKRKSGFIAVAAVLASVLGQPALAETYPTKPIRLLVPYAAGGGTDAIARVVAQGITAKLGQQVKGHGALTLVPSFNRLNEWRV